jgi:valyl-tRNA synthetase
LRPQNRWILSRLQALIPTVEKGLENFELNESAQALYDFTWGELCDWYIELSKLPFREGGEVSRQSLYTLRYVLEQVLRLMHPFMPFVTEELWQSLPWKHPASTPARDKKGEDPIMTLMFQPFPKANSKFVDLDAEKSIAALQSVVVAIRNFRGENNISPKVEFAVDYHPSVASADAFLKLFASDIKALARISALQRAEKTTSDEGAIESIIPLSNPPVELKINLKGLVNVEEESKRLRKEIEKVSDDIAFIQRKLSQETFIAKAPRELVEKERKREQELVTKRTEIEGALARLQKLAGS